MFATIKSLVFGERVYSLPLYGAPAARQALWPLSPPKKQVYEHLLQEELPPADKGLTVEQFYGGEISNPIRVRTRAERRHDDAIATGQSVFARRTTTSGEAVDVQATWHDAARGNGPVEPWEAHIARIVPHVASRHTPEDTSRFTIDINRYVLQHAARLRTLSDADLKADLETQSQQLEEGYIADARRAVGAVPAKRPPDGPWDPVIDRLLQVVDQREGRERATEVGIALMPYLHKNHKRLRALSVQDLEEALLVQTEELSKLHLREDFAFSTPPAETESVEEVLSPSNLQDAVQQLQQAHSSQSSHRRR